MYLLTSQMWWYGANNILALNCATLGMNCTMVFSLEINKNGYLDSNQLMLFLLTYGILRQVKVPLAFVT